MTAPFTSFPIPTRLFNPPTWINVADYATGDGTDQTAGITAAFNAAIAVGGSFGATYPTLGLTALYFPSGWWKAPGLNLTWSLTGFTIFGDGNTSILDGIEIEPLGERWQLRSLFLIDSRGIQSGTYGIKVAGPSGSGTSAGARSLASDLWIRDRETGIYLSGDPSSVTGSGGAFNDFLNIIIESCTTGLNNYAGTGSHFTNIEILNCAVGADYSVGNEIKLSNSRIIGSTSVGLHIHGTTIKPVLEPYFNQLTNTLTSSRTVSIVSVSDNGSGIARFATTAILNISALADAGTIFTRGSSGVSAQCAITIQNTSTGGSIDQITVAGVTTLLTAPVSWNTNAATTGNDLVTAINANTGSTGYSASSPQNNGRVFVSAPVASGASADGTTLAVSSTGPIVYSVPAYITAACDVHNYVVGEDVELNCGTDASTGIAEVMAVPDNTHFTYEQGFVATLTGTVWRPNRLQSGLTQGVISGSTHYNPPYPININSTITACTSAYFETTIPYTSNDTGTFSIPGWDVVIEAQDVIGRTSDLFFTGGNNNYTLIKSGYAINFVGTRLKLQCWIDNRLAAQFRPNRVLFDGPSRGLNSNNTLDVPIGGALRGWGNVGFFDSSGSSTVGHGKMLLQMPDTAGGSTNGSATTLYSVGVSETGVQVSGFVPELAASPSSANTLQVQNGATGARVGIQQLGESTTGMYLQTVGTGSIDFDPGAQRSFRVVYASGTIVNWLEASGGITGNPANLIASGSDTDIDIKIAPKGAGLISFGTETAIGAEVLSGYITIKDSGGTLRKLAVIA